MPDSGVESDSIRLFFFSTLVSSMKDGRWPKGLKWDLRYRHDPVYMYIDRLYPYMHSTVHNYADVSVQEIYSWSWLRVNQQVVS